MRSNYNIIKDTKDYILLKDIGPWDIYKTITNDAEGIIYDLKHILNQRQLRYIDSEGDTCALLYSNTYKFRALSLFK